MECSICGGLVIWKGPLSELTHTECQSCGATNSQTSPEHQDDGQAGVEELKAQSRLLMRVLNAAVCAVCADDGAAKDAEMDKLEDVLRDQGWITTVTVPTSQSLD